MNTKLSGPELIALKEIVVRDFNSSNWRELGALTNTLDVVESHDRLLRSLSWGDPDYEGHTLTFPRKMIGSNDENLTTVQDYISRSCSSAGEDVSSEISKERKIVFVPNVFSVPMESVDPNLLSVMMPFNADLTNVYQAICSVSVDEGFTCNRADDIWDHSTVMQEVFSLIFRSFVVVCDFTDKNPNVFYEAGIANTLGKFVIPITQSDQDIPFDLQHHRYIKYSNNAEGLVELESKLSTRLSKLKVNNWQNRSV